MTRRLADFWPTLGSVSQTFEVQAQSQPTELFLSVHQPMKFEVRAVGSSAVSTRGEDRLLSALLAPPGPSKTIIIPILGDSGIGKSHAIRWLSEQLKRRNIAGLHVVWVPRGESLKQTLGRVLAAFEGTPQHAELKKALDSANELPPSEVRGRLRTALVDQLLNPSSELKARVGAQLFEFAEDCGEGLAAVLQDPSSSWAHFETEDFESNGGKGAITRLSRHITVARSDDEDRGETDRRFVARDLTISPTIQQKMGKLAQDFCGQLHSAEIRQMSLSLLNEILDTAKSRSLELGGADILHLFRQFRAELFRRGKELVLLIEDFTIMSGLQGALYDIMVQTSQPEEDEICGLRTAFALTPGYMQGHNLPENVRTRAASEWHVIGGNTREEAMLQSINLVGAYLNAARVGLATLRIEGPDARLEPSEEMPAAERAILDAFGKAANGHYLFPFNRAALQVLIDLYVRDADYNPRLLLRNVVRQVLEQRGLFESGAFPSEDVGQEPGVQVASEIASRVPTARLPQYLRLVNTWGGRPRRWNEVQKLPSELFAAFGLEPLEGLRPASDITRNRVDDGTRPTDAHPTNPSAAVSFEPIKESDELEAWRTEKKRINQRTAANLRKQIAELVLLHIPAGWPGLTTYPLKDLQGRVYIPNSPGDIDPHDAFVCVALPEQMEDSQFAIRVESELQALLRWNENGGSLTYPGSREDVAIVLGFVQRHRDRAASWLRERPLDHRRPQNPMNDLLNLHLYLEPLRGGQAGASRKSKVRALFPAFTNEPSGARAWDALTSFLTTQFGDDAPHNFSNALARLTCAFQGTGKKPFAFDLIAVWDEISAINGIQPSSFGTEGATLGAFAELDSSVKQLTRLVEAVRKEVDEFRRRAAVILEWAGDLPNSAVVGALQNVTNNALEHGFALEGARRVKEHLPQIGTDRSESISGNARAILAIETPLATTNFDSLAKVNWKSFLASMELARLTDSFLSELEESLEPLSTPGDSASDKTLHRMRALFGEVEVLLRDGVQV